MNLRSLLPLFLTGSLFAAVEPTTPNPGLHYYYEVPPANPAQTIRVDVCVYGGTPGGVGAAVQARRMGKTAALAVFRRHVGGLTSAGLTAVDTGKAASIAGMAMDFLRHAAGDKVAKADGSPDLNFRPSEAEREFRAMLEKAEVPVYFEHRLASVKKDGNRITALTFENGNTIEAKMFIDATYEGDLFARAGVKYFVGREDNSAYGETVNGFQIAKTHQFRFAIDPNRKPGYLDSGLLPGISSEPARPAGTGDKLVQAYNFRMWAAPSGNARPWPKPDGYRRDDYALLERYLTSASADFVWDFTYRNGPVKLNRGDCNNAGPISTDLVGGSNEWPEADYATRERIFQRHVTYQQGMMWYLANDDAVPAKVGAVTQLFGLPLDEFAETAGWPHDLYVREARRMISDYVMTEHNCTGETVAKDSIGLASYTMDSHHTSRVLIDGKVLAEGCIEKKTPGPYPVSYRAIVPREAECANLLVPVCLSSTHVAYGSIRMEPVFMLLGQSAGTAAAQAIDAGVSVQKVDYAKLRERLLADGQKLEWVAAPAAAATAPAGFPPPKTLGDVESYGRNIQRTMRLLAKSTPEKRNTVRVLFYGQSITEQGWWKIVADDLRTRFPNANLVIENRALGGFSSQLLVKTAETDVDSFQPDLLIFHVYGAHDKYEDIIRRVRERTCAEILQQDDHVTKPEQLTEETDPAKVPIQSGQWDAFMNHNWLPSIARKYGTELCDQRALWKRYLADYTLEPKALLRDNVHLNPHGEFLMAEFVKAYLRRDAKFDPAPAEQWVKTFAVGKDVRWQDGKLRLEFVGNRVDVIAKAGSGAPAAVRIDGRKPSEFPELFAFTRALAKPGGKWPPIAPICSEKPLLVEDWTMEVRKDPANDKRFSFALAGSKTGPDGEGRSELRFVSNSGRIVIEPEDWNVDFALGKLAGLKPLPEAFTVRWSVVPQFVDEFVSPGVKDPSIETMVTLAQGLANAKHTLEITGDEKTPIAAIRVYHPPLGPK